MISKISPSLKQFSYKGLNKNLNSKYTVHLNFSPCIFQQKRLYAKQDGNETDNENLFVPPTRYPKGILRSNLDNRKGLGGELVLKTDVWEVLKRTSKRGFFGKLSLVIGFLVVLFGTSFLFSFLANTQNNLTIYLQDAEKLSDIGLIKAAEYYTARDFPRILAGHPIFNYSSIIVLPQHVVRGEVMETDSYGFCKTLKSKFSLPPSLDVQLFFATEIHPNYTTRETGIGGAISVRPDYEYLLYFNKIILYFVKEKKSQVIPKTDKFFPKRNILSGNHYEFLYNELEKNKKMDETNFQRSQGQIQEDSEQKLMEKEVELQRQDKAYKEDPKKR
jgi:hypothetical protein